ncbi:MAG: ROK family protein, partial [Coprobacillus sp.]
MKHYLCIDVGGSSIKYGVIDEDANILETKSVKAPKSLEDMYEVFVDAYYTYESYDLKGIAMSMPGAVDSDTGVIGG